MIPFKLNKLSVTGTGFQNSIMQKYFTLGIKGCFQAIRPLARRYLIFGAGFSVLHTIFYNKVFNECSIHKRIYYTNAVIILLASMLNFSSIHYLVGFQICGFVFSTIIDNAFIRNFRKITFDYQYAGLQFGNLSEEDREKRK